MFPDSVTSRMPVAGDANCCAGPRVGPAGRVGFWPFRRHPGERLPGHCRGCGDQIYLCTTQVHTRFLKQMSETRPPEPHSGRGDTESRQIAGFAGDSRRRCRTFTTFMPYFAVLYAPRNAPRLSLSIIRALAPCIGPQFDLPSTGRLSSPIPSDQRIQAAKRSKARAWRAVQNDIK